MEVKVKVEEILAAKRSRCSDHGMCDQYIVEGPAHSPHNNSGDLEEKDEMAWRGVAVGIDGQQSQRDFA
jgi:hypothetical protein